MADLKISQLTAISVLTPATDVLPVVDVGGVTKKITTNQILASGGVASLASATITGDLTVDTSTLKVDSANNRVGIGTASPASGYSLDVTGAAVGGIRASANNYPSLTVDSANSNGVMIYLQEGGVTQARIGHLTEVTGLEFSGNNGAFATNVHYGIGATGISTWKNVGGVAGTAMTLNSTGLGIGVTPSAWSNPYKCVQLSGGSLSVYPTTDLYISQNAYNSGGWKRVAAGYASQYIQTNSEHRFLVAGTSPTVDSAITFTQAMTLTSGGDLLVGVTSGTTHVIYKAVAADVGNVVLDIYGSNTSATFYSVSSFAANAANAAVKVGRDNTTLRSINAGGTVNASGADYAEYMTKSGDFILSKGDVAGIDSNGKLTNVFADAVSFVVKSTDPSYVGNDKWGVDLEGAAIEAARQLVDRIAFAGQVPVNVTGATAGDYIVPVINGTGIKGISVSKPTFEQYQLAVGKVIAIDTDGRARIIVKVA